MENRREYEEGFEAGKDEGWDVGYSSGLEEASRRFDEKLKNWVSDITDSRELPFRSVSESININIKFLFSEYSNQPYYRRLIFDEFEEIFNVKIEEK